MALVLHQTFGIEYGLMNTRHAYTNSQALHDEPKNDLRGARAATLSIVPVVSIVDLSVTLKRQVTVAEINATFRKAAESGPLKDILGYSDEPLVSCGYKGDPRSSIIDGLSTLVIGDKLVKVLAWYDNEWGFSNRLVDLALLMERRGL